MSAAILVIASGNISPASRPAPLFKSSIALRVSTVSLCRFPMVRIVYLAIASNIEDRLLIFYPDVSKYLNDLQIQTRNLFVFD